MGQSVPHPLQPSPPHPDIRQGDIRTGPRPLPLHLMAHASTLVFSQAALPLWKQGWLSWKPNLAQTAAELKQSLDDAGPEAWTKLEAALQAEAAERHQAMLDGIRAYRSHPYGRDLPAPPVLWREGTTKLLDYRVPDAADAPPVLVVPSLINRAYILDLSAKRSLMRYLAGRGLAPFLVDWDAPGEQEMSFSLTDYVAGRLSRALDRVTAETGRRPALVGYCMGGDLALALAVLRPRSVSCLAMMATPWDFHAGRQSLGVLMRALAQPLDGIIESAGHVPADMLNAMFASLDPILAGRKFAAFLRLKRRSARARDFVALEDWANDGVALAGPVARECLFGWYGANDPAQGRWQVAGTPITPQAVQVPTLALVPARDRIVPPDSALPLVQTIPRAKLMMIRSGHVSMLLSKRAKTEVYGPLARWLVRSSVQ